MTALPRHIDHLNIISIPQIEDNERYWNVNYTPVIPQAVFEIGFFDSTDVIFTGDQKILSEFRKKRTLFHLKNIYKLRDTIRIEFILKK